MFIKRAYKFLYGRRLPYTNYGSSFKTLPSVYYRATVIVWRGQLLLQSSRVVYIA